MQMQKHLYQDPQGSIHACESSEVHKGITLVWTLCGKDVPAGKSFISATEKPTCYSCIFKQSVPKEPKMEHYDTTTDNKPEAKSLAAQLPTLQEAKAPEYSHDQLLKDKQLVEGFIKTILATSELYSAAPLEAFARIMQCMQGFMTSNNLAIETSSHNFKITQEALAHLWAIIEAVNEAEQQKAIALAAIFIERCSA